MTAHRTPAAASPRPPARPRRTTWAALAAGLLALLVLVPAGAAQAADGATPGLPPGKAWVRVGHFVPGMGSTEVDLTPIGGTAQPVTLAGDATYGVVSDYQKLTPGSYTATVREKSAGPDAEPLLSRSFEVTAGAARTVAVVGTSDQPRLTLLTDDLTPPAAGTARVRVLSASQAADTINVTAVDGPTIADGAVLGQATDYKTVPAGDWTLQLQSATADATLAQVAIASGSVYTVVALDGTNGQVVLQVVTDAAGAVVAPQGGAATGGGGTAVQATTGTGSLPGGLPGGTAAALLGGLLAAGAMTALLGRRRRVSAGR